MSELSLSQPGPRDGAGLRRRLRAEGLRSLGQRTPDPVAKAEGVQGEGAQGLRRGRTTLGLRLPGQKMQIQTTPDAGTQGQTTKSWAADDWRDARPRSRATGLLPWAAIWMGCGVALWFALPAQPERVAYAAAGLGFGLGAMLWWAWHGGRDAVRLLGFAAMFVAVGFSACGLRAAQVAAPVLSFRYYGPIEGRVVKIDRSGRDRIRLTLDQPRLDRIAPDRIPARIRISLPDGAEDPPPPGTRVMTTGHLGPPPGPAEPGGFDFRRSAWFQGLGAVGYTRNPVLRAAPPAPGAILRLHRLRMRLSAAMHDQIGGQKGAVSAALMTGDRRFITAETNQIMRDSNLYHIISISGLHMGLLAGFIYGALRRMIVAGIAALGRGAAFPAHKLAAIGAILAAAGYLWLSGGSVATERAFVMVAVMLGAILMDRRALSLRSVGLAAIVILALTPEALMSPGFQMSFAATVALILAYPPWQRLSQGLPVWGRPLAMLLASPIVAGLATAPIAAAHFGRMAHYGVLANLLVVPATGVLIMPMGPLALLLAPLGLSWLPLWLMGLGTGWMLMVGGWVAGLSGAVSAVPQPPALVLPLLGAGAVLAFIGARGPESGLRRGHLAAGLGLLVAGLGLWMNVTRPAVLISDQGDAVGVMTPQGRAMSKPRGGGFTVGRWLDSDADAASQEQAATRGVWSGPKGQRRAELEGLIIVHLTGKSAEENLESACQRGVVVVSDQRLGPSATCLVLDQDYLRNSGAVAFRRKGKGWRMTTATSQSGRRPWVPRPR